MDPQDHGMDEDSSNPSQSDYSDAEEETLTPDFKDLPLEEILALKDQVGLRTYRKAIGLADEGSKKRKKHFKRDNKNRPRELSSKINPNTGLLPNIFNVKKKVRADPRFEDGFEEILPRNKIKAEHKVRQKVKDYSFIEDIRLKEKKDIEQSLASGSIVGEDRSKAKQLLQRFTSRQVSEKQKSLKSDIDQKYTNFLKKAKDSGESVKFMTKKDRKKAELIAKFNDLKKTGKLDKYLEKKRKKNASRDRKKMATS